MKLARPPALNTARLVLRPFRPADAPGLARQLNDPEVTATTLSIPCPYTIKHAAEWVGRQGEYLKQGSMLNFAVALRSDSTLIGGAGLSSIAADHGRAELGYWIGRSFWNKGYCTEACRAALGYAFDVLKLHRVYATHFPRNPASGRVMLKLGMKPEGLLRQHVRAREQYEDLVLYGILESEFRAGAPGL